MRLTRFGSVAAGMAALTLASRVFGFGRWLTFSKTVGDTCLGDAYNAANQLPNVLFEIVAGGVLAGVVIPVVARHVGARRSAEASATASALLTWTMVILTPAAVVAFLAADVYAEIFVADSCRGAVDVAAALLIIFVPQIWLYGLAVVSAGILQAHHRFLAAAAAPLASSVVVIIAYIVFGVMTAGRPVDDVRELTRTSIGVLGWGTTLGVAVLAIMTLVPLARLGLRIRPRLRFASGDTGVIARIGVASVAGLIAQQLTVLLIIWVAKQTHDPGAVTRTTWANAIYLLPFAVLVAPLLQMAFPRLSAAAEEGHRQVLEVLGKVGPVMGLLASLGAGLLVATSTPVARVFVLGPGSGRTQALAFPILAMAPAVVGFALLGLASRTLLAQQRARPAGLTTVVGWLVVMAAVIMVHRLVPDDHVVTGISVAMSVGMLAGGVVGWILVRRSLGAFPPGLVRSLVTSLPAAAVAGVSTWLVSRGLADSGLGLSLLGAIGCALLCVVLFLGLVLLLDRRLVRGCWDFVSSRGSAQPGGTHVG